MGKVFKKPAINLKKKAAAKSVEKKEPTKAQLIAQREKTYTDLNKKCVLIEEGVEEVEKKQQQSQLLVHKIANEVDNIHDAASAGDANAIRRILRNGFQVDGLDSHGNTPLIYACQTNQLEAAILLIGNNANVNHQSKYGFTPLMFASWQGHTELVALLIKHHADVKGRTFKNKDTALHFAALAGFSKACLLLRKAGADARAKNAKKKTPMDNIKTQTNEMHVALTGRKKREIQFEHSRRFNTISKVQEEFLKYMQT